MADNKSIFPVELRPGIFQIVAEKPSSHAYVIKGEAKNVLIDPGLPTSANHVRDSLDAIGLGVEDIDLVVLSHEHMDHIGCSPMFKPTALVAAHHLAANKIVLQDNFVMMNHAFELDTNPFRVDIHFEGTGTLELGNYSFRILHTPGHSSGSICLYEAEHKFLFTGDTVMADGVMGGIFGSGNISDYIYTIKRLGSLQLDEFYPGHGRLSTNPAADLKLARERSIELLDDSRMLFEAMESKKNFEHIFRSARNLNK